MNNECLKKENELLRVALPTPDFIIYRRIHITDNTTTLLNTQFIFLIYTFRVKCVIINSLFIV